MNKWNLCLAIILSLFLSIARANVPGNGVEVYQKGIYSQAFEIFSLLVEEGNSVAQYYIGRLYEEGKGTVQGIRKP